MTGWHEMLTNHDHISDEELEAMLRQIASQMAEECEKPIEEITTVDCEGDQIELLATEFDYWAGVYADRQASRRASS